MFARFTANFLVLLLGAGLVVVTFAYPAPTFDGISLGVGAAVIVIALFNFALPDQGVYQRIADVGICAVGAWAIVAAQVLTDRGRWLEFAAGAGLAALGGLGLVAREVRLRREAQVSEARIGHALRVAEAQIGADQSARVSAHHRRVGARP
jgi:hypothetical protein